MIDEVFASKWDSIDTSDRDDDWTTSNAIENDPNNLFDDLYQLFWDQAEEMFGKLTPKKKNSRQVYGYTISNRYWGFNPHIHKCTINAVYYLNIPPSDNELWGSLWLNEDPDQAKPWDYVVPEEGTLVIMPGDLWHDPFYVPTKEHRVALNMEIKCKEEIPDEWYHDWNLRYI